jgi:pimeloyl-ACP methyl ester carboxylesterase
MPSIQLSSDLNMHYEVDDFTDPWKKSETVLMLHGNCESGKVWFGWVPHLARHYRVARVDLRGFGRSTPMPADYQWDMARLLDDLAGVIGYLGCTKVHLVGAKSGGSMVLTMAARKPELVKSVIAVTPPVIAAAGTTDWLVQIEAEGIEAWARTTMAGRLGSKDRHTRMVWCTGKGRPHPEHHPVDPADKWALRDVLG